MEDNLNSLENGTTNSIFSKWKKTSIFWPMEADLNYLENGRRPKNVGKGKISYLLFENIRRKYWQFNICTYPAYHKLLRWFQAPTPGHF